NTSGQERTETGSLQPRQVQRYSGTMRRRLFGTSRSKGTDPMSDTQTSQKSPYSVGTPSREKLWQVPTPFLLPTWSTSRVRSTDSAKHSQAELEHVIGCTTVLVIPISVVHWRCNRGAFRLYS